MSAASTPAPRSKNPSDSRPSAPRHTLFWPVLIFLMGSGCLAFYQVKAMEEQWDEITQNLDNMDMQVKKGLHEKAKFFAIARDVLFLAPNDPNANLVADHYKLKQLEEAQPELMSMSAIMDPFVTNAASAQTEAATNSAPLQPSEVTNAAPEQAPITTVK